jgi:hypothetical protein
MKRYINGILGLATVAILFYTIQDQHSQINKLKVDNANIQYQYDSLKSEIFVKEIDLQRFDNIVDRAREDAGCNKVLDKLFKETE